VQSNAFTFAVHLIKKKIMTHKTLKKDLLLITLILIGSLSFGTSPVASWKGNLSLGKTSLLIFIHVEEKEGRLQSSFDSPDQKSFNNPFDETHFKDNTLTCIMTKAKIEFSAELKNDTLFGTWNQGNMSFPLVMTKSTEKTSQKPTFKRPQEPIGKPKYIVEEVSIFNPKTGVTLAGTITKPKGKGPFPAVVLVSGSGPQNRDSEVFDHKPFLVLSDYLTRQGIAVLRYDDRGVAQSTGRFDTATSADFADDAEAAFEFLRNYEGVNPNKTGVLGHSEGGMIAPIVAARNKKVSFVVSIAGPGIPIVDLLLTQIKDIALVSGASEEDIKEHLLFSHNYFTFLTQTSNYMIAKEQSDSVLHAFLLKCPDCSEDMIEGFKRVIEMTNNPWFHYFIKFIPEHYWKKVSCPVLAINGSLDVQVSANQNIEAIKNSIVNTSSQSKTRVYEGLNHMMQKATTGAVHEYSQIEETYNIVVLNDIATWINQLN